MSVLRRYKAAELANEQAGKQAAQLAMAQETSAITSEVKQQRLITQVRALKQLNEQHEMQILKLTRSTPAIGSGVPPLPDCGSDSTPSEKRKTGADSSVLSATLSPPKVASRETTQAWTEKMDEASPVSGRTGAEVGTHGTEWELDLAWAALAERRAALEDLLESGPEMLAK